MDIVAVYRVCLDLCCIEAEDYLRLGEWRTKYEDVFATKQAAIRVCQSKFAKQSLNSYVRAVHTAVTKLAITDKGVTDVKRIYNKFKKR